MFQESPYGGDTVRCRFAPAIFPVDDGKKRDSEPLAPFFQGKSQCQAFLFDVVSYGPRLEIGIFWFQ